MPTGFSKRIVAAAAVVTLEVAVVGTIIVLKDVRYAHTSVTIAQKQDRHCRCLR